MYVNYLSPLLKCRLWSLWKGLAVGALISDASFESTGRLIFFLIFFFPSLGQVICLLPSLLETYI